MSDGDRQLHQIEENQWKPPIPKARASLKKNESMEFPNQNYQRIPESHRTPENVYKALRKSDMSPTSKADISEDYSFSEDSDEEVEESLYSTYESPITPTLYEKRIQSTSPTLISNYTHDLSFKKSPEAKTRIKRSSSTSQCKSTSNALFFVLIGIVLPAITVGALYVKHTNVKQVEPSNVHDTLQSSIQKLKIEFNHQKLKSWDDIFAVIYDTMLFPTKPGIIILYGSKNDVVKCLAHLIGHVSGKILGTNDYLALTPKDFKADTGEVIHDLKKQILEKKTIVIEDLLGINAQAFRAFHNFCDRENPLVGHAMYIITVITNHANDTGENEVSFMEKTLMETFKSKIDENVLNPLITRVTDGAIIHVLPESDKKNCILS